MLLINEINFVQYLNNILKNNELYYVVDDKTILSYNK